MTDQRPPGDESSPSEWPTAPWQSQPNPFSREGSAGSAGADPYGPPPPYADPAGGWPGYPGAPENQFGYDPGSIPTYGGGATPAYQPPPGYGTNPYQQSPYVGPYGYVPTNHPQAIVALVLGIVGVAVCPFGGIPAFFVGRKARREIDAAPGRWVGRAAATAGWVLGIIGMVIAALWVLVIVLGVTGHLD